MGDAQVRPDWPFKTPMELARFVWNNAITAIEHKWEMTGVDTAREWLVLISAPRSGAGTPKRFKTESVYALGTSYGSELKFSPDHAGLVEINDRLRDRLEEIEKFDKKHKREMAEYRRLQKKFASLQNDSAQGGDDAN